MLTLPNLLRHFFDRKWAVAHAFYPNPERTNFPTALIGAISGGGEIVFIP